MKKKHNDRELAAGLERFGLPALSLRGGRTADGLRSGAGRLASVSPGFIGGATRLDRLSRHDLPVL